MRSSTVRLMVDLALFLCVLGLVLTGLLMAFVLPPRSGSLGVWGLTRHDWGDVHLWMALAGLALLLLHLAINWTWVCTVVIGLLWRGGARTGHARRYLAGVLALVLLLAIVGGFLWAARASVQPVTDGHGEGRQMRRGQQQLHVEP